MITFDYPWDDAPSWANWAATDQDGSAWWYEYRPCINEDSGCGWCFDRERGHATEIEGNYQHPLASTHWRNSLFPRRPEAQVIAILKRLTPASVSDMTDKELREFRLLCGLWEDWARELQEVRK